ncbi:MAG TPA: HAD-IA family hydrolase [Rhizomicrobium sp.]|nr:HAD-IA family hydrolase [Rhizomicrobium sp.]
MTVLVLDCDGVVLTGHPDGGRWDKDIERDFGMRPELLQARFFRAHWRRIEVGHADLFEVLEEVWPELGARGTARAFVDYWFASDSRRNHEVLALVDAWRARGRTAHLATVQEHHRARYIWETLALGNHFDALHYSAALGCAKPDASFYGAVQSRLPGAAPADVVFLDDLEKNVDAANAFGWRARLFRSVEDLRTAIDEAG